MTLGHDLRQAVRSLLRSPWATLAIVCTLALCMGANTAIYSIVDAMLFRPLPFPEPDRLVQVSTQYRGPSGEDAEIGMTGHDWNMFHDHATRLEPAAYSGMSGGANLAANGRVEYLQQGRVTSSFFRVLGVEPMLGRPFSDEEDREGGPNAAVLSYATWVRVFGSDRNILGKPVMLKGEPYTIVGVMPPHYKSIVTADIWTPLRPNTNGEGGGQNYGIIARLRPGASWAEAVAETESLGKGIRQNWPPPANTEVRKVLAPLQKAQAQEIAKPLWILWAAVGFVLLIGSVNIASLLIARGQARRREIATRMALGGARWLIVRQLFVESLVLSLIGATAGAAVGSLALEGIKALAADMIATAGPVDVDLRVLLMTGAVAVVTALLFGVYPALETSRVDIRSAIAEGSRGVAGHSRRLPRRLLVAGEVALALVLLSGATLLVRSLTYLYSRPPGFDPRNVIAAKFSLQDARYNTSEKMNQLFEAGLERIRRIPGVESAAVGLHMPYERPLNLNLRIVEGPERGGISNAMYVTPGYFDTLKIPLLAGRVLRNSDTADSAKVAVVNESFTRKYFKNDDPIGRHFHFNGSKTVDIEIVGVVADTRQKPGWGNLEPIDAVPIVYTPASQFSGVRMVHTWFSPSWIVRARGSRPSLERQIQEAVAQVDPLLPIASFKTPADFRDSTLLFQRSMAILIGSLAGLALLLAAIGVYGLTANAVLERTRELGIRMALGADRGQAMRSAAMPGIQLAIAGAAVGVAGAFAAVRLLRSLVWGVRPTDPATLIAVSLALLCVAGLASIIPAIRVLRLNAADVLRQE